MGKIIIVGANGSIGKASAQILRSQNRDIEILSRDKDELNVNALELNCSSQAIDISDHSHVDKYIQQIDFDIEGIIFAVGSIMLKPFEKTTMSEFELTYKQNFLNPIYFTQQAITKMSNSSSVVYFSTVAAKSGFKLHTAIASAKSALMGAMISLSAYTTSAKHGNFWFIKNVFISLHPLRKVSKVCSLRVKDSGSLAAYLMSPEASWITGQNFSVDGGRSNINTK